ncbi:MAG: hypothetical protein WBC70_08815, partial [Candidatus Aminicenantales bacterium]
AWMFVEAYPLGTLGTKEKGFQGEMYFTSPNPPVGAVFTYYFKENVQTLKEKREKAEKDAFKEGKPIVYPTYEEMRAEEEEETPYLLFSITDDEGNEVRQLRAPAKAGLHRIVWDFCYPGTRPTSPQEEIPTKTGPSGIPVMPGTYQVALAKSVGGIVTRLIEPVKFKAEILGLASLPAENRTDLTAFQKKVTDLSRRVNAASSLVRDLREKARHFRAALKSLGKPDDALFADIKTMEQKIGDMERQLFGDRTWEKIDQQAEPGLVRRINGVVYDHRRSTSAPTQSQRDAFDLVAEAFPPVLEALRAVAEEDVKKIEERLDELGAPATPGRIPR